MPQKNILLTGASGTIGKRTLEELIKRNQDYNVTLFLRYSKKNRKLKKKYKEKVNVIWGDLLNLSDLEAAIKTINVVIHIAGVIPISKYNSPSNTYAVNVEGTKNLLKAMSKQEIPPRIIYTSSIAVYGDRLKNPWIKASDPIQPQPGDCYAKSKVKAEKAIQQSNLNYCIFRLSYCASTDILKFHPMLFRMPLETSIEIIGISDVAKALVNALEKEEIWGNIFNLGGGKGCRINYGDHIDDILEIMGLGRSFFPREAFAKDGYNCGFIVPDRIEKILDFQTYTLKDFYKEVKRWIGFKRYLTPLIRWFLRKYLLQRSPYYNKG